MRMIHRTLTYTTHLHHTKADAESMRSARIADQGDNVVRENQLTAEIMELQLREQRAEASRQCATARGQNAWRSCQSVFDLIRSRSTSRASSTCTLFAVLFLAGRHCRAGRKTSAARDRSWGNASGAFERFLLTRVSACTALGLGV